jgi:Uma2 family endonuclease
MDTATRRLVHNDRMATQPNMEELWTIREYLRSTWSPDREFVDGRIEERNLGEKEHSLIQRYLTVLFYTKRVEWGVEVFPELRTQTQSRRFRVPDVLVTRAEDKFERYVTHPPLIAIEILSPEDSLAAMRSKAVEYREFGIENIWIIDPEARIVFRYIDGRLEELHSSELTVPGTSIRVDLGELFAELDRA